MKKLLITLAILSLGAFLFVAFAKERPVKGSIPVKKGEVFAAKAKISIGDALKVIKKKFPNAELERIGLDEEDGYLVYEAIIETQDDKDLEICIDAGNGKILKSEKADEDDEDEDIECDSSVKVKEPDLTKLAKITFDEAANNAKKVVYGNVSEIEIENEDGNLFFKVEIEKGKDDYDVYVDAGNGAVVGIIKDEEDEEKGDNDKEWHKGKKYDHDEDSENEEFEKDKHGKKYDDDNEKEADEEDEH